MGAGRDLSILRKTAPAKTVYSCSACGHTFPKWEGRCSSCRAWNSLEERQAARNERKLIRKLVTNVDPPAELASLSGKPAPRLQSGIPEVDRVFGGGIVPGSISLVAGDPGIGKSTLLLQISDAIAARGVPVLYVCGEESPEQIRLRATRLGVVGRNLFLLSTGELEPVLERIVVSPPALIVIDSIQTLSTIESESAPGTGTQIQACTQLITERAKALGVPVVMTGHVTKEGSIAGPKLLEHAVDVVLYLEGDSARGLRLLRGIKNRFGPTDEVGVFEMRSDGMAELPDPSSAFLGSTSRDAPGSALATVIEGTRPFTIEIQALTSPTSLPMPRRLASGIDSSRLALITAVLTRRAGLPLGAQDVIVNVPGGMRVREPAADLAVALAIVSSLRDRPVRPGVTAAAEIGLGGELRSVPLPLRRATEAVRLGVGECLLARGPDDGERAQGARYVGSLAEALGYALPKLDPSRI